MRQRNNGMQHKRAGCVGEWEGRAGCAGCVVCAAAERVGGRMMWRSFYDSTLTFKISRNVTLAFMIFDEEELK